MYDMKTCMGIRINYVCTHADIQINTMWGPGHGFELNRRWRIFVFVFLSSFGWQKISGRAGGKVILCLPCQAEDGLLHYRCIWELCRVLSNTKSTPSCVRRSLAALSHRIDFKKEKNLKKKSMLLAELWRYLKF